MTRIEQFSNEKATLDDNDLVEIANSAATENGYPRSEKMKGSTIKTGAINAYIAAVPQISAGEITAGTETAIRRTSPKNLADLAAIHGGSAAAAANGNFITNPYAETDLTNWDSSDPTNFILTRDTTQANKIKGDGSFRIAKAASDQQNDYVSTAFFVDDNLKNGNLFEINFEYYVSGTYSNDLIVEIYDVDNTATVQLGLDTVQSTSVKQFHSYFVTSNSNNYQLRIKANTASTAAYQITFDNVEVKIADPVTWESESRTIAISAAMTAAQFQQLIDLAGKNLKENTLTFKLADGVHTHTDRVSFDNFKNGIIFVDGNSSDNTKATTKTVSIRKSDPANITLLEVNNCDATVLIRYLDLALQHTAAGQTNVQFVACRSAHLQFCAIHTANLVAGNYNILGVESRLALLSNTIGNCDVGIAAWQASLVSVSDCANWTSGNATKAQAIGASSIALSASTTMTGAIAEIDGGQVWP